MSIHTAISNLRERMRHLNEPTMDGRDVARTVAAVLDRVLAEYPEPKDEKSGPAPAPPFKCPCPKCGNLDRNTGKLTTSGFEVKISIECGFCSWEWSVDPLTK